jgi:hypothetical protein
MGWAVFFIISAVNRYTSLSSWPQYEEWVGGMFGYHPFLQNGFVCWL